MNIEQSINKLLEKHKDEPEFQTALKEMFVSLDSKSLALIKDEEFLDRLVTPDRVITFKYKGRDINLNVNEKGHTTPIVSHDSLKESIQST